MTKLITISLLFLFLIAGFGCKSVSSEFVVTQGSELATVVALQRMEATVGEASQVGAIAQLVNDILSGDTEIDAEGIKAELLLAINGTFDDPQDRLVFMLLCQNIQGIILEQLEEPVMITVPLEGEIVELVLAATRGVQGGVNLYILSVTPVAIREDDLVAS